MRPRAGPTTYAASQLAVVRNRTEVAENGGNRFVLWAGHLAPERDLEGVMLKVSMQWTPKNQNPRPAE